MTDTGKSSSSRTEPWLSGTLGDVPAVVRGVLHALALAQEDVEHWCSDLTGIEVNARPAGLPSIAFQVEHIVGSLDRLLTYAEGLQLSNEQMSALKRDIDTGMMPHVLLREFAKAIESASQRVRAFVGIDLEQERFVGRRRLSSTLGGLLVHIAEHTQRHVGQLVTTATVVRAGRARLTSRNSR